MTPYLSPLAAHRASAAARLPDDEHQASYLLLPGCAGSLALMAGGWADTAGLVDQGVIDSLYEDPEAREVPEAGSFSSVSAAEGLAAVIRRLTTSPAGIEELAELAGRKPRWVLDWIHNAIPAGGWNVQTLPQPTGRRGRPPVLYLIATPPIV